MDTGVNKMLNSEKVWKKLKTDMGEREPKLKKNKLKFIPFWSNEKLELRVLAGPRWCWRQKLELS